ncbi:hypothetical protein D7V80_30890 [Corallococcus sp. CA054B]|uniref:hypothetical protein n=1 Tax=Corallococcus sp. CA054B TaxID=2316734 RepID=UPI000EA2B280|nr:hypothetical protein [Corallococcus sp. CA054B]RKG63386.1 hypothetical protein D7V80_30890 [Corallococcus sp. CA054B]
MNEDAWKWSAVGMFLVGLGMLAPTPARACIAPDCEQGVRFPLPGDGGVVPANVPGLVAIPPLLESMDPSTLRLLLPDGTPVSATVTAGAHGTQVLVPDAPLEPGTSYRIEAKGACERQGPQTRSVTFTAGPALPLPTTLGTLTADTPIQGSFKVYGDWICSEGREQGESTTLRFTPSPELVPFLPWVHWTVEVDGKPWRYATHGVLSSTGEDNVAWHRSDNVWKLLFLYTVCVSRSCSGQPPDDSLLPGRHRATLTATLEHANLTLPPVSVDFELSCPTRGALADGHPRAQCADGGPLAGGGSVDEDPPPVPVPGDSKKGCTQAGGGLTVLGLLATLRLWNGRSSRRAKH